MHVAKIARRSGACRKQGKLRRFLAKLLAEPARGFQQRRRIEQFSRLQHCARPFHAFEPALRVGQRAKPEFATAAQPFARFANQRERGFQRDATGSRLKRIHPAPSRRTRSAQPQQFPQLVELEDFLRRACHFDFLFDVVAEMLRRFSR